MHRKSIRRHRARRTPSLPKGSQMSYTEIKGEALEPQPHYDEWNSYRDGLFNFSAKERKNRELKKGLHKRRKSKQIIKVFS